MRRICTICARGGSKGVMNKNTKLLLGKPLIYYTIEQAKSSGMFNTISVSSDSEEILDIAKKYGVDYCIDRPAELATDHAGKLDAIKDCVRKTECLVSYEYDIIVDLDVTSPMRKNEDIRSAIMLLEENNVSNVITGSHARRSPYFNLIELDNNNVARLSKTPEKPVLRRQDSPLCFDMNASIYVWKRDKLFTNDSIFMSDTALYVMPAESIDIDSEMDFEFIEFLASVKGRLL